MTVNLNYMPTEVFYIIFSYLPFKDSCQLSMTSHSYRKLFLSYLNLAEGDKISVRSLENRVEMLSVPLLQQIGILPKNSVDSFFSLALSQVKLLQNKQLILMSAAENPADPQLLLQAAEKALKQGNDAIFIAIAKNASLQTALSFRAGEFSIMHHSKLLGFIVENFDVKALQQFVLLPAFAQIPCYDRIEQANEENEYIEIADEDLHLTDHIIRALDAEIDVDFSERCAFVDTLIRTDGFEQIPAFALGCILCSTIEDNNQEILRYAVRCICPRITSDQFREAFLHYFSDDSSENKRGFVYKLHLAMLELQITFRQA